jgi:hypothetical protein
MTKLRELRIDADMVHLINEDLYDNHIFDAPELREDRWYEIIEEIKVPSIDGYAWVNHAYRIDLGEWSLSDVFAIHKSYVAEFRETEIEDAAVNVAEDDEPPTMKLFTVFDATDYHHFYTHIVCAPSLDDAFVLWMLALNDADFERVLEYLNDVGNTWTDYYGQEQTYGFEYYFDEIIVNDTSVIEL